MVKDKCSHPVLGKALVGEGCGEWERKSVHLNSQTVCIRGRKEMAQMHGNGLSLYNAPRYRFLVRFVLLTVLD